MHVCFSEVGLSSVRHNPIRTPESLPPSLSSWPHRTWGMDTPRQQQKKSTNVCRGNNKRNTWRDGRRFFTRQKLFYCCTRVLLSIFILKVRYLKGHLLEIAVVANEEKWGQKAKRMTEVKKKKKSHRGARHIFLDTCLSCQVLNDLTKPWPEETENSSTARDHLLTICVVTHKKKKRKTFWSSFFVCLFSPHIVSFPFPLLSYTVLEICG